MPDIDVIKLNSVGSKKFLVNGRFECRFADGNAIDSNCLSSWTVITGTPAVASTANVHVIDYDTKNCFDGKLVVLHNSDLCDSSKWSVSLCQNSDYDINKTKTMYTVIKIDFEERFDK